MYVKLENWLKDNEFGCIIENKPLSGGCISHASRLTLDSGKTLFLKINQQAPVNMFEEESRGLAALSERQAIKTPAVICADQKFILLEDLGCCEPNDSYWADLGEGLANLHNKTVRQFGFLTDNYCGSTLQKNTLTDSGFKFFSNYRIINLCSKAFDSNLLEKQDLKQLEYIAANLSRWIPEQEPALIHGDLWRGNLHCDSNGNPVLVDPAVYWGWPEAELSMTKLFGGFEREFYESYESCSIISNDWYSRAPLYNLYHLLNHLILFGGNYLMQIRASIKKFV